MCLLTVLYATIAVEVINISVIYLLTRNLNVEFNQDLVVIFVLKNLPIEEIYVAENCFMCNNCGRSYKHKRSLYKHQKFECGVQPKFGCTLCFKKFAQKDRLRSHLIMIHKTL